MWIWNNLFIHFTVDGLLDYFQFWDNMINALLICSLWWITFLLGIHQGQYVCLILVGVCQRDCTNLHFHQECSRVSLAPYPSLPIHKTVSLFHFRHSGGCSYWGYLTLMTNEIEYSYMFIDYLNIYSCEMSHMRHMI